MRALSDFTVEKGVTNVIIGSHVRDEPIRPRTPPMRSCLNHPGSVFHGGGRNECRSGATTGYGLAWLRHEENRYLAGPQEPARGCPCYRRMMSSRVEDTRLFRTAFVGEPDRH